MTIQEMIARQQAIVSGARAAGRDLTAEEKAEFDGLQRKIDAEGGTPAQGAEGQGGEDPTGGARGMGNDNGQGTDPTEAARQAVVAERQRVSDITALCRQAGMDPTEYISNGATMDTVRQAAVDYLLAHGAPVSSRMNGDEGDNFRQAAVDAMLLRAGVNVQNPAQGAEEMRGYSLRDLAIECMARDGVGTTTSLLRMSKDDLWNEACRQFFNPTAAFPAILDNAIRKNIVQMYQEIPTTFQLWTTKGSVSDFKPTKDHSYLAGGAAPSIDTLQAAMLKLLHQKDPFGDSIMVEPKYVIVPVGYGFKLAQILETAQIDVTGIGSHTANALYQYRNKLQVIEEGALNVLAGDGNAIPWFVAGDQRYAKSLQVDYLNGQETPTIRRSEVPGRLGFVWDIWLDWGITAVDFRGIAKNPGTTI